jgi:hypothetical protein
MQRQARGRSPRHPMDGDSLPLSWAGADRVAGAVMKCCGSMQRKVQPEVLLCRHGTAEQSD